MTTVAKIVARALRLNRVLDATEAPEAEDAQTALEALNSMMRRWEANGMALGWNDVENLTEALPAPPEAEEAIAYNLAIAISAEFGTDLRQDIIAKAQEGLAALRRDVAVANPLSLDRSIFAGGYYDIRSDSFR